MLNIDAAWSVSARGGWTAVEAAKETQDRIIAGVAMSVAAVAGSHSTATSAPPRRYARASALMAKRAKIESLLLL